LLMLLHGWAKIRYGIGIEAKIESGHRDFWPMRSIWAKWSRPCCCWWACGWYPPHW
jgi:hypothetical protein